MKSRKHLLYSLLTVVCLFSSICSFSQGSLIPLNDTVQLHATPVNNGDTILIQFASGGYVMNNKTFRQYNDTYRKFQNGDPATKTLIATYEKLTSKQDSMVRAREADYNELKKNFDALVSTTSGFVDRTDSRIVSIGTTIDTVTRQLTNVSLLLDDALKKLKHENLVKWKWGVGGFTVGVVVTAVVFL